MNETIHAHKEIMLWKMNRRVLVEKQGYRVLAANTPVVAICLAEAHPCGIDLLVIDVVMPGMNGRNLAERLQALSIRTSRCFHVRLHG